ncbi:MAG: WD40 repeat domain-containing protein [Proteobacteria bacterium]|nr:WD40 repeat domain-containing protein [Pseudomonadota bacterium]
MTNNSYYIGSTWKEGAAPVAMLSFEEKGAVAVALADGRVVFRLLDRPESILTEVEAHRDGLCAAALAPDGETLFTAGEDGKLMRLSADGIPSEFSRFEKAWLEHLAVHESGVVAVAYKKTAVLLNADGKILAEFSDHPSTLGGICFDPKGKRLAASHYGGVSLWWVGGGVSQKPQRLSWKGSHLNLYWAASGKYLLSCMQESALHGWRLPDFADFAMSGYTRKPRSFNWSEDGKWLASAGSPGIVCWDCSGKGPMGRPAMLLGQDNPEMTVQVACHPSLPLVAAGTENGGVYLARFEDERMVNMKTNSPAEIVYLGWSSSGRYLLAGAEDGQGYAWQFNED